MSLWGVRRYRPDKRGMSQAKVQLERDFMEAYVPCAEFTMVDWARCHSVWTAVKHLVRTEVPGAMVECGVWKGGVAMLIANTLKALGQADRELFLYDTFAGMAEPTAHDIAFGGGPAHETWRAHERGTHNDWCYAPLEEVQRNLASTGYEPSRLTFVKGLVQDTIPTHVPESIALLRLDTDWYASTYHELVHLYPRLQVGGVVIFDDAYHWHGQRQALDRYFEEQGIHLMLNRINNSIVAVKTAPHGLSIAERESAGIDITEHSAKHAA